MQLENPTVVCGHRIFHIALDRNPDAFRVANLLATGADRQDTLEGLDLFQGLGKISEQPVFFPQNPLPFYGIGNGTVEQDWGDLPFLEIVLGPVTHRLQSHMLILQAGQDDDHHVGMKGHHGTYRVQSDGIR